MFDSAQHSQCIAGPPPAQQFPAAQRCGSHLLAGPRPVSRHVRRQPLQLAGEVIAEAGDGLQRQRLWVGVRVAGRLVVRAHLTKAPPAGASLVGQRVLQAGGSG